ncbi:amidohydrolase [Methanococcus vannielii SB]|uniref:Amidohydrolase n=1 Tax=Methanococcus vannielii (strain ATCC 35089 / DSM 1224 / JCM 13029 / OCM 148 / SB) TaxID=406327 RepID=A6URZ1_METVS|nr:amidohydrolase [Methanococcus vannielii]ABR55263.1 amidohydrolase [Methanococcus vannielii SB]
MENGLKNILIKNVSYYIDGNLNIHQNCDILIEQKTKILKDEEINLKKNNLKESMADESIANESNVNITFGKSLIEKKNLNKSDIKIIDGKRKCAIPGLYNAHTHIPMTLLRGISDDMALNDWLNKKIWPNEAKLTKEDVYTGSLIGCLEMLRFGVTTFNEMYFFSEEIVTATKEVGLKAQVSYPIMDFGTPDEKNLDRLLNSAKKFVKNNINEKNILPGIAPHAPYTCSEETYIECKEISIENNINLHTHVSETRYEVVELENKINMRPIDYLEKIGVLNEKLNAAHCVWITKDEAKKLSKNNVKILHCPTSNMKLASGGVMPAMELLNNGANISLGTDGPASNNNLDIIREMKTASLLHKSHRWDPTVLNIDTALKMGINSESIGFKNNDIVLLDLNSPHFIPINNIKSNIVYCANGNDVDTVIVDGKILLENKTYKLREAFINTTYKKACKITEKFN